MISLLTFFVLAQAAPDAGRDVLPGLGAGWGRSLPPCPSRVRRGALTSGGWVELTEIPEVSCSGLQYTECGGHCCACTEPVRGMLRASRPLDTLARQRGLALAADLQPWWRADPPTDAGVGFVALVGFDPTRARAFEAVPCAVDAGPAVECGVFTHPTRTGAWEGWELFSGSRQYTLIVAQGARAWALPRGAWPTLVATECPFTLREPGGAGQAWRFEVGDGGLRLLEVADGGCN